MKGVFSGNLFPEKDDIDWEEEVCDAESNFLDALDSMIV